MCPLEDMHKVLCSIRPVDRILYWKLKAKILTSVTVRDARFKGCFRQPRRDEKAHVKTLRSSKCPYDWHYIKSASLHVIECRDTNQKLQIMFPTTSARPGRLHHPRNEVLPYRREVAFFAQVISSVPHCTNKGPSQMRSEIHMFSRKRLKRINAPLVCSSVSDTLREQKTTKFRSKEMKELPQSLRKRWLSPGRTVNYTYTLSDISALTSQITHLIGNWMPTHYRQRTSVDQLLAIAELITLELCRTEKELS